MDYVMPLYIVSHIKLSEDSFSISYSTFSPIEKLDFVKGGVCYATRSIQSIFNYYFTLSVSLRSLLFV